ncbi:MAG: protein kinase [Planctomycetes bacterium]|nr:protein kinase [Planctomycetota bacterium]
MHQEIDHYEVIRKIGSGGMGTVYLCKDKEFDRTVALKVMNESKSQDIKVDRERFTREAMTTAGLQHPGIPPVFRLSKTSTNELYYAMKLIEGMSLHEVLVKLEKNDPAIIEKYTIHRLVEILIDVCQTLEYVHSKGYIHRDLKPSNIFIGDYGEVYIIDWGLTKKIKRKTESLSVSSETETTMLILDGSAKTWTPAEQSETIPEIVITTEEDGDSTLTRRGSLVGTPAYMSPEQAQGGGENMSEESDVYALGVILYRILTLKLPTKGMDFRTMMKMKIRGETPKPEDLAPGRDIPPELSAISLQAMAPRPEERFKSVNQLTRSLEFWLEGKTQFRLLEVGELTQDKFICLPESTRNRWLPEKKMIKTVSLGKGNESYYLLRNGINGDLTLSMNLRVLPPEDDNMAMRDFGIIFKASEPIDDQNNFDHYAVRFAVNNNTRMVLMRNGNELTANEYVVLEPNRKYSINIELSHTWINIRLDKRLILSYQDRRSLTGPHVGFVHMGQPVIYNRITINSRGRHLKAEAIDIPEALMAEGCFEGSKKRFLEIFYNHRARFVGMWAAYRAAVASYRGDKNRSKALEILSLFQNTRYAMLEPFGMARIALLDDDYAEAAVYLNKIINSSAPRILLAAVADLVFEHTQELLRSENTNEQEDSVIDQWVRIALALDQKSRRHDTLTISIIWRWIYLTATNDLDRLPDCIEYIHQLYGKNQGEFQELVTRPDLFIKIIQRSISMKNHTFLIDKIMRLVVWHEDSIEGMETLGRYYLHSGYEKVTMQVFQQIIRLCLQRKSTIPPGPIAYVGCRHWMRKEYTEARKCFQVMINHSESWAISDGQFFLGLDDYRQGKRINAVEEWRTIAERSSARSIKKYIAKGLLRELPSDPNAADVPKRSDYRMLYSFFVGFRTMLDWQETGSEELRMEAIQLFKAAKQDRKPSHDIYASTESFFNQPLELLGVKTDSQPRPPKLDAEEKLWLKKLVMAIHNEVQGDKDTQK